MSDVDLVTRAVAVAEEDPSAVLAIVGPTASGKTALAIDVAERIGGEIVSADSVQIYRGFDVGSGKPTAEELARVPHHLIGAIDPLDAIDARRFGDLASAALADITARGKRPIVCGGTFLWVKALLFGLAEAPAADDEIRARHKIIADLSGRSALHVELAKIDPASAKRLHPNDFVRVSRALEVHELSGKTMTEWQSEHGFAKEQVRARMIGISVDPAELTRRIEARVRTWLRSGWIEEVRDLSSRGYADARAMGAVGYREIHEAIARAPEGAGASDLVTPELEISIVRATRVFARRQRTWLHHSNVLWL